MHENKERIPIRLKYRTPLKVNEVSIIAIKPHPTILIIWQRHFWFLSRAGMIFMRGYNVDVGMVDVFAKNG